MTSSGPGQPRVVSLNDLAPRAEVQGGSGRRVFGQDTLGPEKPDAPTRRAAKPLRSPKAAAKR